MLDWVRHRVSQTLLVRLLLYHPYLSHHHRLIHVRLPHPLHERLFQHQPPLLALIQLECLYLPQWHLPPSAPPHSWLQDD